MPPRRPSSVEFEAARAMLSLAGIRQLLQANISALATANTSYTVADIRTRRVVIIHLGAGNGDIRFNFGAAAASTNIPVPSARFMVVDAEKDQTLQFFNTTAGAITVYFMEID